MVTESHDIHCSALSEEMMPILFALICKIICNSLIIIVKQSKNHFNNYVHCSYEKLF